MAASAESCIDVDAAGNRIERLDDLTHHNGLVHARAHDPSPGKRDDEGRRSLRLS